MFMFLLSGIFYALFLICTNFIWHVISCKHGDIKSVPTVISCYLLLDICVNFTEKSLFMSESFYKILPGNYV